LATLIVRSENNENTTSQVPLRIGLTDHPADSPAPVPLPDEAPWSARLAARLLREVTRGSASPWSPYIAVLPHAVPTPVLWSWDRITSIAYQPAADHLHETHWVVEAALAGLTPEMIGRDAKAANDDGGLCDSDADLFRCARLFVSTTIICTQPVQLAASPELRKRCNNIITMHTP
jgi:hypothetical protein